MSIVVDIQWADDLSDGLYLPGEEQISQWAKASLQHQVDQAELSIRVVSDNEMQNLNQQFRGKANPTNVLSFPADLPEGLDVDLLGDIVIAASVVAREAEEQCKPVESHWAHMVVHGCLHLLGFDHNNDADANEMEHLETEIMQQLNFENPYGG
ncbi:MAG: rRNA maturation RNase YbeY [Nitrosopumilus sp.]|nr:rRNA maturation RNase YbeY [Gammaproteobacteria bacterium]MDH5666164.1 rRNA maturation RNase YbeY [Nitrosopumilus sp.]MDH5728046.1 rRNA maturation RNase YbeY [Gammaproteobacteria bacterium]